MRKLRVIVEADGGSRGNPGPAGYGAVVLEAGTGEVLMEVAEALGVSTNNVAEYGGLIAGLKAAADLGAVEVEVRMDSKLVVEQMSGRWQIKNPGLRPLAAKAADLVRRFSAVTFTWIPRELNRRADALANRAMDEAAGKNPGKGPGARASGASANMSASGPAASGPRSAATREGGATEGPGARASGASANITEPAPAEVAGPESGARGMARRVAVEAATAAAAARTVTSWEPRTGLPLRLLLVRHGETALTAQRRYSGRGEVPLTDRGLAQAHAVAARIRALGMPVSAVVTSPLERCVRTAECLTGAPIVVEPDLIECDFGVWEGLTFTEVRERWPDQLSAWLASTEVAPPGGESFIEVARRVERVLAGLRAGYLSGVVVVVSHVSPLKLILRDALGAGDAFLHRCYLDPAGLSMVDFWADGGIAVRTVNDTAHLRS